MQAKETTTPTIVNMDFLRSKAYAETSPATTRRRGDDVGATSRSGSDTGPRSSKNKRLETFYQKSLKPHSK